MTTTINKSVDQIIQDNMMGFSAYILTDRCMPDFRDGLKPVHRRILWAMYKMGSTKFTKSANAAGEVFKYHPHGDTYPTIVGMVQKDRHIIPLLEGKGNFAQYTSRDLAPAASRYTEVKLSEIALDMMQNLDKNLIDFVDNYDSTKKIPEVLPAKFPAVLVWSNLGIGVGFSSSIPSFNLVELCDAIIKYIETGEKTILVPDFATGGSIIKDDNTFKKINEEGIGTIKIRGKVEIKENEIWITEIPYSTTRESIIEKIIELAKKGKLKEVIDVKDLTGLEGMLITVTARKGTDMKLLLEKLYKFTPLQSTFSVNMNILVNNLPKLIGVWETIDYWLEWRRECITRGLTYDIKKMEEKLHLLKGFEKVLIDIDKVIEIIRKSDENMIEKNLQSYFGIDEGQAKEIANMRLRDINKDYITKKIKDIKKIESTILLYKEILKDINKLNQIVIKGLKETKEKYGRERRTKVIDLQETPVIQIKEEVPNYPIILYLTKEGYCYKFKTDHEPTLKPGDKVIKTFRTTNDAELLVFNANRTCFKIKIHEIDEVKPNQLGIYLPNLIKKESDIDIVSYSVLDDKHKILIAAYSNNKVAKINLESFNGNRRILKNSFNLKQELIDLITLEEDTNLKIITDKTELILNTSKLSLTNSRSATGIYATKKGKLKKVEVA